jgi:hypothetical protein
LRWSPARTDLAIAGASRRGWIVRANGHLELARILLRRCLPMRRASRTRWRTTSRRSTACKAMAVR